MRDKIAAKTEVTGVTVFPIYSQALFLKHTGDLQRRGCLSSSQTCFDTAKSHPVTLQLLSRLGTAVSLKAAVSSHTSASGVIREDPHFRCTCLEPWASLTLMSTLVRDGDHQRCTKNQHPHPRQGEVGL